MPPKDKPTPKKLGRPRTAPPDQMKFTVYLEGSLVWEMRKVGITRKLYGDNEIMRVALQEWLARQKKP